jgi:hypothetical protein
MTHEDLGYESTDYVYCTGVPFSEADYCFRPVDVRAAQEAVVVVSTLIIYMAVLVLMFNRKEK